LRPEGDRLRPTFAGRAGRAGTSTAIARRRPIGSSTRPATLAPGETRTVTFRLGPAELGYWSASASDRVQEAEAFDVWVGADSWATLHADFAVVR
jgi:hypothetical protein